MLKPIRRVVTGHNKNGEAIIAIDTPLATVQELQAVPGTIFHEIWRTDTIPAVIDNGVDPTTGKIQLQPKRKGTAIRVVDIPPDTIQHKVTAEQAAKMFASMGVEHDAQNNADSRHALMHCTETIDYGILLSGELWLVMDDGETKLLPGDIVVQRGTNHAWSNRSNEIARIVFILIDGAYSPEITQVKGR